MIMNPYWFMVFLPIQALLVSAFWIKGKKRNALRYFAVLFLCALIAEGVCLGWTETMYSFNSTTKAGVIITVRHGRSYGGPLFEVDVAPEVFVGYVFSPLLRSIGTYGAYEYEWGLECTEPAKLLWEGPDKCWIERFGDSKGRGMFAEKNQHGQWTLVFVHKDP